ncbi:MAG: hypothetical protein Q9227_007458 [Pyrenula ochraceoflavens]
MTSESAGHAPCTGACYSIFHRGGCNRFTPTANSSSNTSSAENVATWFAGFFQTLLGLSTLGASITFSYVLSSSSNTSLPRDAYFSSRQLSHFLALSWLLFVLALAFTSIFTTLLQFYHADAISHWTRGGHGKRLVLWYATLACALLYGLVISAFIFLCLVDVAYAETIGWVATGFAIAFAVLGEGCILIRSPLGLVVLRKGMGKVGREPMGIIKSPGDSEA